KASGVTTHGIRIDGFHELATGERARRFLPLLQGAVGCVLLIGCANVASLLLARSASRRSEIAVRLALGAGRGRLVRQLLTESLLLSTIGGGCGLLLAWWGAEAIASSGALQLPPTASIRVDGAVLLFSLALSILTGLLFGLAP